MIRLRRPALDDKSIIKLIKEQLYPMTRRSFPNLRFRKREVYDRLLKGVTYVVRKKGIGKKIKTIGFIHAYTSGKVVWIDLIAMDPKLRSKGWGSKLMQKAELMGRRKECDIAYVYVDKDNTKGQKFYHRQGYKEVYHEKAMNCYLYSKVL